MLLPAPLPLGERGQGVRALVRDSATTSPLDQSASGEVKAYLQTLPPVASQQLDTRSRAKPLTPAPLPCMDRTHGGRVFGDMVDT